MVRSCPPRSTCVTASDNAPCIWNGYGVPTLQHARHRERQCDHQWAGGVPGARRRDARHGQQQRQHAARVRRRHPQVHQVRRKRLSENFHESYPAFMTECYESLQASSPTSHLGGRPAQRSWGRHTIATCMLSCMSARSGADSTHQLHGHGDSNSPRSNRLAAGGYEGSSTFGPQPQREAATCICQRRLIHSSAPYAEVLAPLAPAAGWSAHGQSILGWCSRAAGR